MWFSASTRPEATAFVIRFRISLIIAIEGVLTLLVACYSLHLLSLLCVYVFHVSELHIEVKFGVYPAPS
jgi:hypothetical protein